VNCSPSLDRVAGLFPGHNAQGGPTAPDGLHVCFRMRTNRSASLLHLTDYGFAVGHPADVVIINAQSPEQAISEIAQPITA
jgi:cytosine deaminase